MIDTENPQFFQKNYYERMNGTRLNSKGKVLVSPIIMHNMFIMLSSVLISFLFHSCANLELTLSEFEKHILKVCKAPLPRDVENLQGLVVTHKQFESDVQSHEPEVNQVKNLFNQIPQKTDKDQEKLDKVLGQWDRIWSFSSFYVERLKTVEITLTGLEEVTIVVNEFEMKLSAYDSMPSDMENLRKAHDDLMTLEAEIQEKQVIDIVHVIYFLSENLTD